MEELIRTREEGVASVPGDRPRKQDGCQALPSPTTDVKGVTIGWLIFLAPRPITAAAISQPNRWAGPFLFSRAQGDGRRRPLPPFIRSNDEGGNLLQTCCSPKRLQPLAKDGLVTTTFLYSNREGLWRRTNQCKAANHFKTLCTRNLGSALRTVRGWSAQVSFAACRLPYLRG